MIEGFQLMSSDEWCIRVPDEDEAKQAFLKEPEFEKPRQFVFTIICILGSPRIEKDFQDANRALSVVPAGMSQPIRDLQSPDTRVQVQFWFKSANVPVAQRRLPLFARRFREDLGLLSHYLDPKTR